MKTRFKSSQPEDLTGKRFGLLTVLNSGIKLEMECEIRTASHCRCDCGATLDVVNKYLKRGSREHCGSFECKKRLNAQRMQASYTPGYSISDSVDIFDNCEG